MMEVSPPARRAGCRREIAMRTAALAIALALLVASVARAEIHHVPAEFPTIQAAIDAAVDGDTVLVSPGTYTERVQFLGKEIEVRSTDGPGVTTIDGGGGGPVVRFLQGEGPGAILEGFTITGGTGKWKGSRRFGGGIVAANASPTIRHNFLVENEANVGGAGAFLGGAPRIENNVVDHNLAINEPVEILMLGGAFAFFGGAPEVLGNEITWNALAGADMSEDDPGFGCGVYGKSLDGARFEGNLLEDNTYFATINNAGGAIYLEGEGFVTIRGNRIEGNSSCAGGGIYVDGTQTWIEGNTIRSNFGDCSDGAPGGGIAISRAVSVLRDNFIEGNETYLGGGIAAVWDAHVVVVNCILLENRAGFGGGVGLDGSSATAVVTNCTFLRQHLFDFWGSEDGAAIWGDGITATNCILRDNVESQGNEKEIGGDPVVTYSNVETGWPGVGNIDEEPLYAVAQDGWIQLRLGSPGIDAGDDDAPELPALDPDGDDRILDGDGDGIARVDMGSDEVRREIAVRFGNISESTSTESFDVMTLNGSIGDRSRVVSVAGGGSLLLSIVKPPLGGSGRMVIHANLGEPTVGSLRELPASIGTTGFPLLLPEASPSVVWNNLGRRSLLGESVYFGSPQPDPAPAPATLLDRPAGDPVHLPVGTTITCQGILVDPGSASPKGVSVTNAVVAVIE